MTESTDKWSVLLIASLSSFLHPFMGSSINIALPSIGREFAMDAVLLSWVATSSLLATGMFLVPFGRIADVHGRKRIFTYGILIYIVSSLLSTISNSAVALIFLRALYGVGSAMAIVTSMAMLTSVFPLEERGKALGIMVAAVYSGFALGPFLGGFLTQNFGWRSIFLINAPVGLTIIASVLWRLKGEWAEAKGERIDLFGSMIFSLVLTAIMYGFSILPDVSGMLLLLMGVFGVPAFIWWETKAENPVLNIKLFTRNRIFAVSNVVTLLTYAATFSISFLLSLYLQHIKGLTPQNAGLILACQPFVQAVLSPFAGKLSDKVEPRIVVSIGMVLIATTLSIFSSLNENTSLEVIAAGLILFGFGFALFSSPNTNAIMSSVESRFYGVASATVATMRTIGQTLSMGVATIIFTVYLERVQITPEHYPIFLKSVDVAFVIYAVICFLGILASLTRGSVLKK